MNGWLVAFIVLCIVYGPVYVFIVRLGIALDVTSNMIMCGNPHVNWDTWLSFGVLGLPFIFTGYMAIR
jgi:hypothetical protein